MKYRFLRYPEGKTKAVTFSYDDGSKADLRMLEIMEKNGIKGTFNLTSEWIDRENMVTREEVQTLMLDRGHEVAVHGTTHKANGLIRPIDGIRETLQCRLDLEQMFDRIIRGMAYQDSGICRFREGTTYEDVKCALQQLDIVYSRTLGNDNNAFELPTDWYAWMPTAHHDNPKVIDYIREFLALNPNEGYISNHYPRLFYLWGHSHELARNGNWDHFEQICELLGGQEDIWYATNIEIHDYVKAYDSLVFSADGSRVYNPTLLTVWFNVEDTLYRIAPGETIRL